MGYIIVQVLDYQVFSEIRDFKHTVGENIVGALKMQNDFGSINF